MSEERRRELGRAAAEAYFKLDMTIPSCNRKPLLTDLVAQAIETYMAETEEVSDEADHDV